MYDITSNLTRRWTFDSTLSDTSGTDTFSTGPGSPSSSYVSTLLGKGVRVVSATGASDLSTGDIDALDFGEDDSFSVSVWVRLENSIATQRDIVSKKSSPNGTDAGWSIYINNIDIPIFMVADGTNRSFWQLSASPLNEWSLITCVIDRSDDSGAMYQDGVLVDTTPALGPLSSVGSLANSIGLNVSAYSGSPASIDDLRIYSRALSADDVAALWEERQQPTNPATVKTTLSASAVDAVLSDFPMPITNTGLGASMSSLLVGNDRGDGSDLWGNSTGLTNAQTGHKVGYWDNSGNKFLMYAALASASNLTDTDSFTHVGGNPGASDPFRSTDEMILPLIGDFNDVTSNGNDGTAENGLTAGGATGPDGSLPATSFDGVSEYVSLPGGTVIVSGTDITVMGWFFDATHKVGKETLINIGGATNGLLVHLENGSIYGVPVQASNIYPVSSAYTANQWNHFAVTANGGGSVALYLNGVQVDTTAFTTVTNWGTDSGGIGATGGAGARGQDGTSLPGSGGQAFAGNLCLFSASSTTLSAAEIKANYLLTGPNAATYLSAVEVPENTNTNLRDFLLGYDPLIYVRGYLGGNLGSAGTIGAAGAVSEGDKLVRKDLQSSVSMAGSLGAYKITDSGLCSQMSGKTWGVATFQTTQTGSRFLCGAWEPALSELRYSVELNRDSSGSISVGTLSVRVVDNSGTPKSLVAGVDTNLGFTDGETHTIVWSAEPSTNTVEVWYDGVSQTVVYSSQETPDTFDQANFTNGFGIGYFQRGASPSAGLIGELQEVAVGLGDAPDASALQDLVDGIQASYDQTLSDLSPTYAWALDEAFGTTAYNWIGAANNGTISSGVTLDQNPLIPSARSMSFDGTSNAKIVTSTGIDTDSAFTLAAWFNTSASGSRAIAGQPSGTGTGRTLLFVQSVTGTLSSGFGGSSMGSAKAVNDGRDHLAVLTFTGGVNGTKTLYLDGVVVDSEADTGEGATGGLNIGSDQNGGQNFLGTIDEVAFWEGTALTAEQVGDIYDAGATNFLSAVRAAVRNCVRPAVRGI